MNIHLLRHGRTTRPGTYTGVGDIDLSSEGVEQIRRLRGYFAGIELDRCYVSPLRRCRASAELLAVAAEIRIEDRLKEIDFGAWEGLDFATVIHHFPGQVRRWEEQTHRFTFPGGESLESFSRRVAAWFDELLETDDHSVLVVAHGGVIRVALCHLLGLDPGSMYRFAVREAGATLIVVDGSEGRLELFNYTR